MKCPNCQHEPISFSRFFRSFNLFRIQCVNCGAKLKANYFAYLLLVYAITWSFAIGLFALSFQRQYHISNYIIIPGLLLAGAIGLYLEYAVWKYGKYKILNTQ